MGAVRLLCAIPRAVGVSRAALVTDHFAVRQQIAVLRRPAHRPRFGSVDRSFWIVLSKLWEGWHSGAPGTGMNFPAPPYHIVAANALQLVQDIGGGVITPVGNFVQFDEATDLFIPYTGRMGADRPFAPAPGQADLVSVDSAAPHIASHDGPLDPKSQEGTER